MTKKIDFLVPAVVLSLLCPRLSLVVDAAPPARGQSSLVGHWRLDDIGQDARIDDASPNGLHGILAGATADRSVDGKTGRAIRFPAAGSIRLGQNAAALGRLTDFSVSMWIQYDGGASRMLFSFADGTLSHRVQMEVHNGRLHFGWQNGGSFTGFATGELSWTPGQWYHVAFINDDLKGKTIVRSNDAAHAKHADTTGPLGLNRRIARVEIGSLCGSYPFNGCIDDVRLYNTALSKADVAALFTNKPTLVAGVADDPLFEVWAHHVDGWADGVDCQNELKSTRKIIERIKKSGPEIDFTKELAELAELEPVLQKTIKDNPNAPTKSGQKDLSELLAASIYGSLDLDVSAVNGTYTLQLLLHEGYQTDRSADIVIEGKKVVENYNFWDKQGKTFDHASVLEYTFTLTDGNIDIEFKEYNGGAHLGGLILSKGHGKPGMSERIVKSPADLDSKDVIKAINFGHTKTLNIDGVEFVAAAVNTTVNGVTNKAVSAVYPGQYGQHIPKMELNRENSPFGDVYIAIRRVKRKAMFKDPDGLLAHWKLDDKEPDQRVVDSSGNKFHAICSSQTSVASVSGKIGRAFRFPEAGWIFFNHPPSEVTKLTDFTLSFWYQPSSDCWQFHQRVFAFGGSGYRMEIDKGAVNIQWREGNVSRRVSTPVLKWKAGQWYHLVFVNNSKTGKTILRSNDLAWAMDPNTFAPAQVSASIKQIELGCRNSVRGTCAFLGCIDDFLHYNSPPPIGNPRAQCMDLGAVDDVRLYERTLSLEEQLAIYDSAQSDSQEAGRSEALAALKRRISTVSVSPYRYFQEKVKPKLSGMELEIKSEWLFQAENEELGSRIKKEITWTSELLERLRKRAPAVDVSAEMNALNEIIPRAEALTAESEASRVLALYFHLRQVKRKILFKSPEVDFSKIICLDSPVPGGNESLTRGEMHNRNGSRLLILDDIAGTVTPRQLVPAPDSNDSVSLFRFDLSHDAQRVVFSMKPEKERAYHLYEVGIDGNDFRQITSGTYSDIDPIHLPQGGFAFLSTRGEVYVQCGPWARAYVLTRCDANGSNVYLLSPGTEAEYSPSLLDDGRILYTRWEYVDKGPQRIQSLWTMRPDGTAASAFWGNQSVWPDHLGDARQIPGTTKVLFKATSHHEFSAGCIGIVDPKVGVNYPDGIWKVTQELPWPEVGEGPIPIPGAATDYHTSGQYVTYHTPYPLSEQLFLVSAGRGWRECLYSEPEGANRLFLMDIYGNRELIYQGRRGISCAQPVRPRKAPACLADTADFPGSEKNHPVVRPGVFFSSDIYADAPPEVRKHGKFLRVVESMPKNYSTGRLSVGGKRFGAPGPNVAWTPGTGESLVSGPATGLSAPLGVKQVLGTVPIHPDGSVQFKAPPCRMLYFQVLDKEQRCVHTMRSWVSVRPGEYRGCVGCHELQSHAPAPQWRDVNRDPDLIQSPPWGVRSLSYIKDIQPIFDRACGQCHQGQGEAVKNLDLTLRPPRDPGSFGGIFPEPYLTLMMGKDWSPVIWTGWKTTGYLAVPPVPKTRYDTLPPLSCLSPKSRLISEAMDKNRCGEFIKPEEIQMLIAWIDLWGLYRSDEDCREIEDPPAAAFRNWGYPPKCKSAARVRPEYSQDEYTRPEDRRP